MKSNSNSKDTFLLAGQVEVSRMGDGAMQLTGKGVWGDAPDRTSAKQVLNAAVDAGVNFIDTAESYGPHRCEVLIQEALSSRYDSIVVATKGGLTRPGPGHFNSQYVLPLFP